MFHNPTNCCLSSKLLFVLSCHLCVWVVKDCKFDESWSAACRNCLFWRRFELHVLANWYTHLTHYIYYFDSARLVDWLCFINLYFPIYLRPLDNLIHAESFVRLFVCLFVRLFWDILIRRVRSYLQWDTMILQRMICDLDSVSVPQDTTRKANITEMKHSYSIS